MDQLAEAMGEIIPTAKNAGVSVEQLGAAYAIMTASGIKAAPATTKLGALFEELNTTGSQVDKILRQIAGGSFQELMQQGKSVGDVLEILSQHAEKSGLKLSDLFGSGTAGEAALALMKNGADGFNQSLKEMENSAGTCDKAFEMLNNTTEKKVSRAFAALKNLLADVGTAIAPVVGKIAELGEKMATAMSNFVNAHPKITTVIVALGGLVAAIGPVLLAIGTVIALVPTMVKGFDAIKNAIGFVKTGFTMLKGAITAVAAIGSGPLLAIAAGIAAVAGAVVLWKKYGDEIKAKATEIFNSLKETISNTWNNVKEGVSNVWNSITTTLGEIWNNIATACTDAFNNVKEAVSNAWNGLTEITSNVWNVITTILMAVWNVIKAYCGPYFEQIKTVITNVWNSVVETTTAIWNGIVTTLSTIWNNIKTACTTLFDGVKTAVMNAWNGIVETTTSIWNSVLSALTSIWNSIKSACMPYFNAIKTTITNIWNGIKNVTTTIWNNIKNVIQTVANAVKMVVSTAWNAIKNVTTAIWNGIKAVIQTVWNTIKSLATANTSQVKTIVQNGFSKLREIAQTAWNNVVTAIKTAWVNIKNAVTSGASRVVSACRSAFSNVKEILTAPFRAARDAISGILGGIKDKISSIASFGRSRAMEVAMPYRISTYVESVQENAPMLLARKGGGIVGDLEGVQQLIERTFPDNGEDLIKKFAEAGKEAGEKYVEELRKLEPLVTQSINRMASSIEGRTEKMSKMAITTFATMTSRIIAYMSNLCNSTINYWNQMRATLGQTIRGEIIVTHRDIFIEEHKTEGGGGASGGKKMLARMFSVPQTDTMQTLALLNTDAAAIRFRDMQNGGSSNARSKKGDIIDYDKLGKAIAKYQKGDVKIENTYNSPKPASIKELKQQDEILLRRLKKQKRI